MAEPDVRGSGEDMDSGTPFGYMTWRVASCPGGGGFILEL